VAATFAGLKMHMENQVVSKWTDKDTGEELEWRFESSDVCVCQKEG